MATKTTTISVPQQLLVKGRDMLHIFETMVDAFEVLFVMEDLKPAARIELHENNYAAVRDFCAAHGLNLELSFFKILKPDKNASNYDPSNNVAAMVKPDHPDKGHFFAYVSKSADEAQKARFYEHICNDERLGELLGYPSCCVKFYKDNYEKAAQMHDDYCFFSIANTKENPLFYTNNMLRFFDVALVSHFPCSFECVDSLFQAKRRLEAIRRYNPALADYVADVLRGPVIAHAGTGIHAIKGCRKKGDKIFYKDVWLTSPNPIHNLLISGNNIQLVHRNHVKIFQNETLVHEQFGNDVAAIEFE